MSIVIGVNLNKFRGGGTPTPPSPIPPTSYTNPGGSGNRVGSIAVTATCDFQFWAWPPFNEEFINGDLTGAGQVYENAEAVAGKWVNFDFGAGVRKVIDESTLYMSNGLFSMGNRKWQGSVEESATPADGSFVDIGGAFAVGATPLVMTELAGNATGYRHYRLIGVSGNCVVNAYWNEFEFKIRDA